MSAIPKHKMTVEEYIEFDRNNEGRWEYFDGEVIDMAGGTLNHNQIASVDCELFFNEIYSFVKFPPMQSVIRPV